MKVVSPGPLQLGSCPLGSVTFTGLSVATEDPDASSVLFAAEQGA